MLMSQMGGTNGIAHGSISFRQDQSPPSPYGPLLLPNQYFVEYGPSNYGGVEQMPRVGSDPPPAHTGTYSADLSDLEFDNPNGHWKLFIYDWLQGASGHLDASWALGFKFQ
jgi:hypothetical protein